MIRDSREAWGLVLVLGAFASAACGFDPYTVSLGQSFDPDLPLGENVDQWVGARVPSDYPGAAVLVIRNDVVMLSKGYGLVRLDAAERPTDATPFYLAEASMSYTAAAILLLHQDGLLDLSARVTDLLPDAPDAWGGITVHHLLNHTAGMRDYRTQLEVTRPGLTNDQVMDALVEAPLQGPAGGDFRFSRSGYVVLAEIVELVSGQSFRDFVQENIFDPLGMDQSYVVDESSPPVPGRAIGHGDLDTVSDYELRTLGDAGVYSSLRDVRTWLASIEGHTLISPENTALMLPADPDSEYGYGWFVGDLEGRVAYFNEGGHPGFKSFIGIVPEAGMTIVVLTSGNYPWPSDLAGIIMAHVLGV